MKSKKNTVFIVELFVLFIIMLVVVTTIMTLSMKTRSQSFEAGRLTEAVSCAENIAEVTSASSGIKQIADMAGRIDKADAPSIEVLKMRNQMKLSLSLRSMLMKKKAQEVSTSKRKSGYMTLSKRKRYTFLIQGII